eukprot:6141575-Pleurochrysis_carterae.AAC.1
MPTDERNELARKLFGGHSTHDERNSRPRPVASPPRPPARASAAASPPRRRPDIEASGAHSTKKSEAPDTQHPSAHPSQI